MPIFYVLLFSNPMSYTTGNFKRVFDKEFGIFHTRNPFLIQCFSHLILLIEYILVSII